ncbi:hypothetical protein ABH935_001155 [Catenulispora sp. GAS73]|uniref:hypothetical protein n=1 Tax=Catenulispora sp. GAS73 TaxID=3156269 RepID=UPI003517F7CB
MIYSESATSDAIDDLAPWWAWGYVLAIPFALLTLVTPWFRAVPPVIPGVFDSGQHIDYHAWDNFPIGLLGPVWLVVLGGQWFRARRDFRRPPGPSDWRRRARRAGRPRSAAELDRPYATGAWYSLGMAAASLALLGINRALFRPTYSTFDLNFTDPNPADFTEGKLNVHAAIGCWFLLIAVALFVATSIVGLVLSDRQASSSWEPELRKGPL